MDVVPVAPSTAASSSIDLSPAGVGSVRLTLIEADISIKGWCLGRVVWAWRVEIPGIEVVPGLDTVPRLEALLKVDDVPEDDAVPEADSVPEAEDAVAFANSVDE
jgi:hypothetical protein